MLGIVAAAHGAVLLGLTFVPAARSFAPPQALAVALVAPPASAPAAPARPQQQPVPTPRQALPLATPLASPEPDTRAAAPAQSSHATAAAPAQLAVAAASSAAPAAPAAPAPILPPRFDAAYLNNPRPPYPPLARRMGEEGKATLRVFVTPEGLPGQIDLAESAGSPRLDEAALEAVRHWRFVPARQGETAVAAWVRVPIAFRLEKR
ncbi:MAG: energy transducer TonB [Rhodocyclales bacterium]|nr:energy transducer TonB [Rhodocyclales bacterium]